VDSHAVRYHQIVLRRIIGIGGPGCGIELANKTLYRTLLWAQRSWLWAYGRMTHICTDRLFKNHNRIIDSQKKVRPSDDAEQVALPTIMTV